nr:hypothetical protein [Tanacetum cinerariifolium]
VEARLVEFKEQEIKFCKKIRGLERDVEVRNNKIEYLMNDLGHVKKEKEGFDNKLTSFESALKDLDTLLGSQRSDKNKEGLGYNAFPPPLAQVYSPPKKDLAVLLKTGKTPISRPNMNVAQPKMTSFTKTAHSNVKRPFQRRSVVRTQPRVPRVSTIIEKIPTVDSKFPTAKSTLQLIWESKEKLLRPHLVGFRDLNKTLLKKGNIDDKGYWDSGCSRHMTCNISYLSEFEPYDRGYVSFGQGGGKITGKGIIKTGKLKFENVYFVKELKYNLFSVSQICDNKNSVMFTDSECIVLGKDFKLKDDTNVLLRTPRQHNMYYIDLNNINSHKNLTCLVAKASIDESMVWQRRLVVTNDFSRFTWTFFLRTKDETSSILRNFITEIENLKDLKVKIIRCDNRGEFKNKEMNELCTKKGIRREFSNARTPQQNEVAERRNRTLIEAAKTMLADAKLPVTFWAEAVNTACYVQNGVLVNKSQNKTPDELFNSRIPAIGFLRPFGCHVMILNTLDHLGNFDAKGDEGYFVGYSMSSKAFRVFNKRTKKVKENLHVDFLENKLIEKGAGPNWLFDIDTLTNSMNYVPVVVAGTSSTNISGTKDVASQDVQNDVSSLKYIALPNWFHKAHMETKNSDGCNVDDPESSGISNPTATLKVPSAEQVEPAISLTVETKIPTDTFEEEADLSNMETSIPVSPTSTLRIHKDHPKSQIIGLVDAPVQTRHKSKEIEEQSFIATIQHKTNPDLLQFCVFVCFLSQEEPKKIFDSLKDPSWVEAIQEEFLQFKIQNAWILVDCLKGEEGINYEEVFAPVARIEVIRLFLAYASFMGFIVYQVDVKSAFLYGTIDEEVYVMQPPGFQDPEFPDRVDKVEKAMYGLHQTPRALYGTLSKYLLDNGFQR